jgi:hypothetical protein
MRFDIFPFSPRLIQARWTIGKLPSEDIPWLAQDALCLGYDGSATRRLAGLISPTKADVERLMSGFFADMGLTSSPSREQAALILACYVAQEIIDGREEPYDGASFIESQITFSVNPVPDLLLSLADDASDYENCSPDSERGMQARKRIEEQIISDALSLLFSVGDGWR